MYSNAQALIKNKALNIRQNASVHVTSDREQNKVLVVGYSPTGGGHTARTLNIVKEAVAQGSLIYGDMVIFYVPPHWEGTLRLRY